MSVSKQAKEVETTLFDAWLDEDATLVAERSIKEVLVGILCGNLPCNGVSCAECIADSAQSLTDEDTRYLIRLWIKAIKEKDDE